ncbi:MAG: GTP-binding protein [Methanomicrobiales archaeon]|nr:GTP-binding protein [Methanomicrobiales archaeon]
MVVFGPHGAGKSTFIHALDPEARHVEAGSRDGSTTVALDFGRVRFDDMMVYLFGTPGQERFEFARGLIARGMDAAILVVDATIGHDELTARLHCSLEKDRIPHAILLNKCDLAQRHVARLRERFGEEHCYPISALREEDASSAFRAFISACLSGKAADECRG